MKPSTKTPLLTPILRWFMLAMVLANISSSMFGMLLPLYITELGATVGQVGLVFTVTSVFMLGLQILGGYISDSIGRLRAIALGSIGGIIGNIAIILAPTWQWLIVALIINMIPYALVGPSFGAFIAENSSEENRGRVYGVTEMIYQITGVLGPPLGGFLAGQYGFRWMFVGAALLYAVAAVLRIWMARTMKSQAAPSGEALSLASFKTSVKTVFGMILSGGVITWIFLTDGVRDSAFRLSGELQPLYLEQIGGLTLQQIGLLGSIFSFSMMFVPLLSGRLSDKFGERVPITGGFLMVFVAMMIFLNASTFAGFALTWVVFGVGVGVLSPAYQSLISKVVPQKSLGIFSGLFYSSVGLVSLPAPWLGAQLWERFNPRVPFMITAGVALLTVIPIWLKFKVPEKEEPVPAEGLPSSV
ncbi:MAG: MFS transporter [Anaerolineales bacterium]